MDHDQIEGQLIGVSKTLVPRGAFVVGSIQCLFTVVIVINQFFLGP